MRRGDELLLDTAPIGNVVKVQPNLMDVSNEYFTLNAGDLLLQPDVPFLASWRSASESLVSGWARLANAADRREFENSLAEDGWTFFFLAGVISATAYGLNRGALLSEVAARLVATVKLRRYNGLEIQNVEERSLLGISRLTISAHPRHIQKGNTLLAS